MNRRIALLIAAVIIAALGTSLVFVYVKGANDRAVADQKPVQVLVAKTQIAAGTSVQQAQSQGAIESRKIPKASVAPGALSNVAPIQSEVAITTIYPGQQLLSNLFGAAAAAQGAGSLPIPKGDVAVSFSFQDPNRVAGFVVPGSQVAVFLTSNVGGTQATKTLLNQALVIGVGPTTITPPANPKDVNTEQVPRALLTLALSPTDAQKVIFGQKQGDLYLGLLGVDTQIPVGGAGVNDGNLFG